MIKFSSIKLWLARLQRELKHMDAGVRQKIIDDPNLAEEHKLKVFAACKSADNETEIERNFNA